MAKTGQNGGKISGKRHLCKMTKEILRARECTEKIFEFFQKKWGYERRDKGKREKIKIYENLLTFEKKYDIIPTVAEA